MPAVFVCLVCFDDFCIVMQSLGLARISKASSRLIV